MFLQCLHRTEYASVAIVLEFSRFIGTIDDPVTVGGWSIGAGTTADLP